MGKKEFRNRTAPQQPTYPTRVEAARLRAVGLGAAAITAAATGACWPVATSGDIAPPYEEPDGGQPDAPPGLPVDSGGVSPPPPADGGTSDGSNGEQQ